MELFPSHIAIKFTVHLKNALRRAAETCQEFGHEQIDNIHLLFGIVLQKGSLGANILANHKISQTAIQEVLKNIGSTKSKKLVLTSGAKSTFKKAALAASNYEHKYIGTEHLLWGILDQEDPLIISVFNKANTDIKKVKNNLRVLLESASRFPDLNRIFNSILKSQINPSRPVSPEEVLDLLDEELASPSSKTPALDYFCLDLTDAAEKGKLDPVIGRQKELAKTINILGRKIKNNPILIGPPGVGKTAIVYALAQKIASGEIPENLADQRILQLDLGLLVAGSVFRGEFEARLKNILFEVEKNPNIILFIDEMHTVVGAGSASGSLDAANILKPALSRGTLRCIGATTLEEFRQHFKKDAALERRFQSVLVKEPPREETIAILEGLKKTYEDYHGVNIIPETIDLTVDLGMRYISSRYLPDKALDILDEACVLTRSKQKNNGCFKQIKELEKMKNSLKAKKEKYVKIEDYVSALEYKKDEERIANEIEKLKMAWRGTKPNSQRPNVGKKEVIEIIAQSTGIPLGQLEKDEREELKNLEKLLSAQVIGQNKAISEIAGVIRRSRANISNPNRPIGSFIFLGPSGVGKTYLAKILAKQIFSNPDSLIKIDMSEFMERHNVSRLIGAPAGYIGFEEGGKLTEAVKLNPYSLILFDEIEKAHPDVANILLQILEEGELTDARGDKINFKNTIIIITSNLGTSEFTKEAKLGFRGVQQIRPKAIASFANYEEIKDSALKELKEKFSPEFLNRIDKIIVFNPLTDDNIKEIIKLQFLELKKRLEEQKIFLELDNSALKLLLSQCFSPLAGARLVRQKIESLIENPLAEKIIEGEIKEGDRVAIGAKRGKIELVV